jgi:hypothetical protein
MSAFMYEAARFSSYMMHYFWWKKHSKTGDIKGSSAVGILHGRARLILQSLRSTLPERNFTHLISAVHAWKNR